MRAVLWRVCLLLAVCLGLVSASTDPSRKQRLAALPADERVWLTEFVAPIILPYEENVFLELTEPYQFEAFKKTFWERRERQGLAFPLGPGYQTRYAELRRLADDQYDGWREDAGRMVLARGEPESIQKFDHCNTTSGSNTFRDLEVWTYSQSGSGLGRTRYMFYRRNPSLPRKLWTLGVSDSDVLGPGSCRRTLDELHKDCPPYPLHDPCAGANCQEACEVWTIYSEIRDRQGSRTGAEKEYAQLLKPDEISTEGLEAERKKWAESSDAKAKTLTVASSSPRPAPEPTPTPEPRRLLSRDEMRDRIIELEPKYRRFLDFAGPLLTEVELSNFLQLTSQEKDRFIRGFWKKRE